MACFSRHGCRGGEGMILPGNHTFIAAGRPTRLSSPHGIPQKRQARARARPEKRMTPPLGRINNPRRMGWAPVAGARRCLAPLPECESQGGRRCPEAEPHSPAPLHNWRGGATDGNVTVYAVLFALFRLVRRGEDLASRSKPMASLDRLHEFLNQQTSFTMHPRQP